MRDLLSWFKDAHVYVKLFVGLCLAVIVVNVILVLFINMLLTFDSKANPYQRTNSPKQSPYGKPLNAIEYQNALVDQYEKWMIVTDRLEYLVNEAKPRDSDWHQDVAIQITQMKTLASQARQLNPPYEHEVAHTSLTKAISEFSWASDNLMKSISDNDARLTDTCMKKVTAGRGYLDNAMRMIEAGL